MMEMEESGNYPSSELMGKKVCTNHFYDLYINRNIENGGEEGCCSYCKKKAIVRDMYDLGRDLLWKITMYYTDIENADLPYASDYYDDNDEIIPGLKRIGEYVAPVENEVFDSVDELMEDLDLVTDDDELNEDIKGIFSTEQWISKDFYEEDQTVHLSILWEKFCKEVTSQRRFTFLATPDYEGKDNILERLDEIVVQQELCRVLPKGTTLYRARKIKEPKEKYDFYDITSAPNESAFPNRMSPAGISMFYASFDKETPMSECVGGDEPVMIIGKFKTCRNLLILDLTRIPENSFWMDGWQENKFLHKFNKEITKPTDIKDTNHLQYVPSQIMTEYFRYMLRTKAGRRIDGIIYGSSKTAQRNIVLFCNQQDSENFVERDVEIDVINKIHG